MVIFKSRHTDRVDREYGNLYNTYMSETRITSTELARKVGDVLGRVRYAKESFVVVRNGVPVARLTPFSTASPCSLRELFRRWKESGECDESFADTLEQIGREDSPLENPWDTSSTQARS